RRQEGAEEGGGGGPPRGGGGGGAVCRRGRGDPGLRRGGPQRADRRRPPAAGGLGVEAARAAHGRGGQLAAGGGKRGLPPELTRLRRLVERGLAATAELWPAVRTAYAWVHRAAHLVKHAYGQAGARGRRRYAGLVARRRRAAGGVGALAGAVRHFVKATRSYWPGLFACYDVPGLPRTNNDLEQFFGAGRYHERRVRG